jgi:conjugative relaxase-like TrwC/TraI family protein
LGLQGRVNLEAFNNLLYGLDPSGNTRLVGRENGDQTHDRNAATDIPLSSPKSFSVVGLFDLSLREAFEHAAVKTAEYIDTHFVFGRQTHAGITEKVPGEMIATLFMHGVSRANDVHLHAHLVVMNMVVRPDDSFSTMENRSLFQHQAAITQTFYSHMSDESRTLGYGIEQHLGSAGQKIPELAGYRQEVNDLFSKRHETITSADQLRGDLEKRLPHQPEEAREALIQLQTKSEKNPSLSETEMVNRHNEQLEAIGITSADYLSELKAVGKELNAKESLEQNGLNQTSMVIAIGMEREENRNCKTSLIASDHTVGEGPNLTAVSTDLETIYTERLEELKAEAGRMNEGDSKELTQGILLDTERSHELQHHQDHELAI